MKYEDAMDEFSMEKIIIGREFNFSAAHYLPGHEKCKEMHGHNYRVLVEFSGEVNKNGMVMDFSRIKEVMTSVLNDLDHRLLNEIIAMPTVEEIIIFIKRRLQMFEGFHSVTIWETPNCYAKWERGKNNE